MFDYIADGQMTLFDLLGPEKPKKEPEFKIDDVIYKVILDVIETGTIDHMWELEDGYGYSAKKSNGTFITFWTRNIGVNVFSDKIKAIKEAERRKNLYTVIRADEMKVIKERNFIEICSDGRICISATAKLLEGNMVYWSEWYTYPFLEVCRNETEANKHYSERLNNILNKLYQPPRFEVNIPVELKDMYLCANGKWSSYDYASFNGEVLNSNYQIL